MHLFSKLYIAMMWCFVGVLALTLGIICGIYKPLINVALDVIKKETILIDGTKTFEVWSMSFKLFYMVYLFNVTNPDEVLKGKLPRLVEHGPYIYDEFIEREILEVDEIADEIKFVVKRKFRFNKAKSTNVSEDDILTILNMAYIGTINMVKKSGFEILAAVPGDFINKFGNIIPKLFPDPKTIFIKGKAKNLLFDGSRLTCYPQKHPDLTMICSYIQNNKPEIMKTTAKEGLYLFSLFNHLNGSTQGPFTVNRGVKNISRLADITSYRNARIQNVWKTEKCNVIAGTDGTVWPPMQKHISRLYIFSPETCQSMFVDYSNDAIINGIKTKRYALTERMYELNKSACCCPEVTNQAECPPRGLLDLTNCQGGPVFISQPHFLHADPDLLRYARDLNPNEKLHSTELFVNTLTGLPLAGRKTVQLNMKVRQQPVDLLANVSEGYFPLVWTKETIDIKLYLMAYAYQSQRLIYLFEFLHWIPLIVGIYILLATIFLNVKLKKTDNMINPITHGILVSRNCRNTRVHFARESTQF